MRIWKVIASLVFPLLLVTVSGCSPLSKSQMRAAGELTFRTDTISRSPEILLSELADIRRERGLFYAASLTAPDLRVAELNAIAAGVKKDRTDTEQSGVYVSVLNSYLRALKSLSSDSRHEQVAVELRGIGRRIDRIFKEYNSLDTGYEDIPVGYATLAGEVFGYVSESIMRSVQGRALKETVVAADSLVGITCDSLSAILKSSKMNELIENEQEALEDNYSALLSSFSALGNTVPLEFDRQYVELVLRADELKKVRNNCVSALRSLKNAHHKLAESYAAGRGSGEDEEIPDEFWDEVERIQEMVVEISEKW